MFNGLYNTYPNQYTYGRIDSQLASMQSNQMSMPVMNNGVQQMQNMQGFSGSNIISVTGIEGARAFNIAPNSSVLLLDGENPVLYLKTSDSIGMQKITMYRLTEDQGTGSQVKIIKDEKDSTPVDYVTRDDFNALQARVQELIDFKTALEEPISK